MAEVTSILNALLFGGESPDMPVLKPIDLGEEQQKATKSNTAALPGLENLASRVNDFTSGERLKALRNVIPGLDTSIADLMAGLGRGLKGQVPIEDRDRQFNTSAAKALGSGAGGLDSGFGRGLVERDLGLQKQDIFYKSLGAFQDWLQVGSTYLTGPQMDISTAFISPMQQVAFDVQERNTTWNYEWFRNQYEATRKEPWEAAVGGLLDWVANTGLSAATMGLGSVMGGGGGMGGGMDKMTGGGGGGGGNAGSIWGRGWTMSDYESARDWDNSWK